MKWISTSKIKQCAVSDDGSLLHPVASIDVKKRRFVLGASTFVAASTLPLSGKLFATETVPVAAMQKMAGNRFDLSIDYQRVNFTGRSRLATTVNNGLPGPTLYWKEGERVTLRVTNHLHHDSSIHWHGLILPSEMDGVPGLSFDGIKPGETFEYSFDVRQNGTYWYHSHSGFQEQTGLMGAIIIAPKDADPVIYDRDFVIMLSDWSDTEPQIIYSKLKKQSHYYNFRERTIGDFVRDLRAQGWRKTQEDRAMWNNMRMSQTDIADVTGYTYTYLMNGVTPDTGWMGLCKPGEKVRLRIINAAAMSIFDVRIPGLKMTVVAADGQYIQPVIVDEFRIGVAETYDVIVELAENQSYTLFAQSNDRSGYARGTLTTNAHIPAVVPAMDAAPLLTHRDMGMDHSAHGSGHSEHVGHSQSHSTHAMHHDQSHQMNHDEHAGHVMHHDESHQMHHDDHAGHAKASLAKAGYGSNFEPFAAIQHSAREYGPHVDGHAAMPMSGLQDPGVGLRDHQTQLGRRVLTYADLKGLYPTQDRREPSREIELHLTGNMRRYMWSINGVNFADAEPLLLQYGERVRIILVNDTMMIHPIHLHGFWSELETGDADYIPRKHTVLVQPGARISYLVTADAKGRWAYHCHLLYHMLGMMREVRVV